MIFKTYNSYFNGFIEKPLLLFPFTSPKESILFLFKYVGYVNMNFGCYGCSKHPKKDPKTSEKHPKRSEKHLKTSENIRKTSKPKIMLKKFEKPEKIRKNPNNIIKTSEKNPKKNYGIFLGCCIPFCIVFNN